MFHFRRVAATAAAVLMLAGGIAYADPSQALDAEVQPITSRYIDHASAMIEGAPPEAQAAAAKGMLSYDVDFSTPVAQHAVATVAADIASADAHSGKLGLAALVDDYSGSETVDSEQDCLAGAVYFESKGEPLEGQLAVAEVILNRADSGRFPASICGVVKQRGQFSFVRGGRIPAIPRSSAAWRKAVAIAKIASDELATSASADAMFFHARYVSPGWRGLKRVGTIGNHIFYR